jgi:hypothetical protein
MFANYSDSSCAFLRLRLPLTLPSAPLSPMGEGIGVMVFVTKFGNHR